MAIDSTFFQSEALLTLQREHQLCTADEDTATPPHCAACEEPYPCLIRHLLTQLYAVTAAYGEAADLLYNSLRIEESTEENMKWAREYTENRKKKNDA